MSEEAWWISQRVPCVCGHIWRLGAATRSTSRYQCHTYIILSTLLIGIAVVWERDFTTSICRCQCRRATASGLSDVSTCKWLRDFIPNDQLSFSLRSDSHLSPTTRRSGLHRREQTSSRLLPPPHDPLRVHRRSPTITLPFSVKTSPNRAALEVLTRHTNPVNLLEFSPTSQRVLRRWPTRKPYDYCTCTSTRVFT